MKLLLSALLSAGAALGLTETATADDEPDGRRPDEARAQDDAQRRPHRQGQRARDSERPRRDDGPRDGVRHRRGRRAGSPAREGFFVPGAGDYALPTWPGMGRSSYDCDSGSPFGPVPYLGYALGSRGYGVTASSYYGAGAYYSIYDVLANAGPPVRLPPGFDPVHGGYVVDVFRGGSVQRMFYATAGTHVIPGGAPYPVQTIPDGAPALPGGALYPGAVPPPTIPHRGPVAPAPEHPGGPDSGPNAPEETGPIFPPPPPVPSQPPSGTGSASAVAPPTLRVPPRPGPAR